MIELNKDYDLVLADPRQRAANLDSVLLPELAQPVKRAGLAPHERSP